MSFVEKNKTWILPVLGLGAGAVVWFNIRTFNPPAPSGQTAPSTMAAAPAPPPAPEAPPAAGAGAALWDDLSPVTFVPAELGVRATLEQQALTRLGPGAFADPAAPLVTRPGAAESPRNPQQSSHFKGGAPAFAPPPDFLIEGPGGTQAWFDGHGYRTGQPLRGHPFTVQGIQIQPSPGVTLHGATGSTSRSTRHAPAQEAP
jgi:hypothetical protein